MINHFKYLADLKKDSVFLVEDKKGEKFVLKKSRVATRLFHFSKLVHQRGGDLADLMPEFFAKDGWFWQKFLAWELAGDTVKTLGIKKEAFVFLNPQKLARAIIELQRLNFRDSGMEERKADFYLKNTEEFRPALEEEFGQEFTRKVLNFFNFQKDLVDKNSHFLANGDLHPQNLMYQKDEFRLIDWDLLHFNNPAWDLTDLYVWGWRNKHWGKELLNEYKKDLPKDLPIAKDDFEKIFAFDVVYLASQLIKHAKLIKASKEFLENQKQILKATISPFK